MRSVAAYAKGLMALLGANADAGKGLSTMDDAVKAQIDIERFLGLNRRINGYFPLATLALGNNVAATVPKGRVWCIRGGGILADTPAAMSLRIQARIRTPASNVSTVMGPMLLTTAGGTDSVPLAFQDFLLEAGTELIVYVPTLTGAGPFPASFTVLVEEFEA